MLGSAFGKMQVKRTRTSNIPSSFQDRFSGAEHCPISRLRTQRIFVIQGISSCSFFKQNDFNRCIDSRVCDVLIERTRFFVSGKKQYVSSFSLKNQAKEHKCRNYSNIQNE